MRQSTPKVVEEMVAHMGEKRLEIARAALAKIAVLCVVSETGDLRQAIVDALASYCAVAGNRDTLAFIERREEFLRQVVGDE